MELHPQTAEVMSQLELDHIEGYDYVLADDLEVIVSHKLSRIRKNPVEDVADIVNDFLLWHPSPPKEDAQQLVEDGEKEPAIEKPRFDNINELIRDTANHYRALDHKNSKEESVD